MSRQLVITLTDEVYEELRRRAGQDDLSDYIERLVCPSSESFSELERGYRAMADDHVREQEAVEWIESDPADALL
ncbi:MAG: antitoxin VapB family protein [Chloroflexota bacterium]